MKFAVIRRVIRQFSPYYNQVSYQRVIRPRLCMKLVRPPSTATWTPSAKYAPTCPLPPPPPLFDPAAFFLLCPFPPFGSVAFPPLSPRPCLTRWLDSAAFPPLSPRSCLTRRCFFASASRGTWRGLRHRRQGESPVISLTLFFCGRGRRDWTVFS